MTSNRTEKKCIVVGRKLLIFLNKMAGYFKDDKQNKLGFLKQIKSKFWKKNIV